MSHNQYIRSTPNTKTAVLFIHGFLGSPKHFTELVKRTSDNVAIYNILLEGHNAGVKEFGRASMAKWKKQIEKILLEITGNYESVVIVAHSMGTFFAMDAAIKYPDNVKSLLLMQSPLKIGLKLAAPINTVKSFFAKFSKDPVIKIYQNAHSVKLSLRIWEYARWIPRYLELFAEAKKSRQTILNVKTPTYIFQSKNDELVSMKSLRYIPDRNNISLTVLNNSAHFIYDKNDFDTIIDRYLKLIIE